MYPGGTLGTMLGVVLRLTPSKDMAIAIEGGAGIGLRHSAMLRAM